MPTDPSPPSPFPDDLTPASRTPAAPALIGEVYQELRALAAARLQGETPGHTLQPTALVHEVYLKLARQDRAEYRGRTHFFAVAAEAIRRVLVDHARIRQAAKRGAGLERLTISASLDAAQSSRFDLLAIDDALQRLAALSPRQARVVELRFFGGLDVAETAEALDISENTVKGDWRLARAWLRRELSPGDAP
ncbi:MAG: ECF-type sigma factor [Phycisphaerae bacterium]